MADAEQTKNTAAARASHRRSTSTTAFARRALAAVTVASLVFLAIEAGSACLPDLAAIAIADAAPEATPIARFEGCGDGIIATLDDGGDAGESCDPGADAEVPGCTADCRIECDGGIVDPKSNHCYFVAGKDTTFVGAIARCATARGHVVTVGTQAEADLVSRLMPSSEAPTYWVGLARNNTLGNAYAVSSVIVGPVEEPGFPIPADPDAGIGTGPCTGCFGIGDDAGVFPPEVASVTISNGADCLASAGGGWVQVPCNATTGGVLVPRATICEREPIGARAQDCIGGFCFTLGSTELEFRSVFIA